MPSGFANYLFHKRYIKQIQAIIPITGTWIFSVRLKLHAYVLDSIQRGLLKYKPHRMAQR